MKRRLAIILCGLLLIESLPLSVLGSTTLDLPVENASVWYTDETARENGQYGETVEESLFAEQGEATSCGRGKARSKPIVWLLSAPRSSPLPEPGYNTPPTSNPSPADTESHHIG